MDAALDGTSVGAVSADASSFSFFAATRAVASERLADLRLRKRIKVIINACEL
jgi:hypothetical protein|tara:strand:+ start:546 stop:704 length:159 start_codon:yes stop_codon:yes gene_type:complete